MDSKKNTKRCSKSLATREMKIKTRIRYCWTPIKPVSNDRSSFSGADDDEENLNSHGLLVGNIKWCNFLGKYISVFLKM
jgi:hypothetical protein